MYKKILQILDFQQNIASDNCFNLDFRGYRIMCINDKFYFLGKKSASRGSYVWDETPEDCKNNKAKLTWRFIQEVLKIDKNEEHEKDYIQVVVSLLTQMFLRNTIKIGDMYGASGNQYYMAENAYKRIKEVNKNV